MSRSPILDWMEEEYNLHEACSSLNLHSHGTIKVHLDRFFSSHIYTYNCIALASAIEVP